MKKNRAPKTTMPETSTLSEKVAKPAKPARKKKAPKCKTRGCKLPSATHGFCRLHYLSNWKALKEDEKVRAERRLNAYVDRLAKRYPDDYLEKIKEGIEDESMFNKTMETLELDRAVDDEPEAEREYLEKMSRNIKGED